MGQVREKDWIVVERLGDIVLSNVEGCIVEIGMGYSTIVLSQLAKKHNRKHYACDIKETKCIWAKESTEVAQENLIIYHEKSSRFIYRFKDIPALVFIDGNHYYKYVKPETEFFVNLLNPGGMIFLHDTHIHKKHYDRYEQKGKKTEAYMVRQELEKDPRVGCLTFPYTASNCGLTVAIKKESDRPFYQF